MSPDRERLKSIFTPIRIGAVEIPNRLVVPAMVMNYCREDGTATDRYIAYHEAKARGGWGLIITEDYAADPRGKGFPNIPGLWEDRQIEGHRRFTDRIHTLGTRIFAQIYHAGRQTSRRVMGFQPLAPSALPCPAMREVPHELTVEEIRELTEQFGDCARRVREAGFDGLELHGAHGYLIAQFMSPYANKRSDAYGGDLTGRMRFPLEVMASIRKKIGDDFPIIFRISGDELVPGGRKIEETKIIAAMLERAGVQALHVSAGVYESAYAIVPPAAVRHGWITDLAAQVKSVVSIPVITVGRINDPRLAEEIVADGKADLVAMGRASLADPELPRKAKAGEFSDINHCIGCLQGCNGRISLYRPATCLVNPTLGKEEELRVRPAAIKRKVFIAGAGPSGMAAAMVAAKRGHEVHIFEKTGRMGGQLHTAAIPPHKEEIAGFIAWQSKQLDDLGVSLHLDRELTEEMVEAQAPDALIVATGSIPMPLAVADCIGEKVVTAQDVLEGNVTVGPRVVVIGGGMIGSETACHLAHEGRDVTIVEKLPNVATDVVAAVRYFLLKDLKERNIRIIINAAVKEIAPGGVSIEAEDHTQEIVPFDTIVLAMGAAPHNALSSALAGKVSTLLTIGSARKAGNALEAIAEGFRAGLEV